MRLIPSEIQIDESAGFTNENDIFQRKQFAENITNLLEASDTPLVIALDSPWGSGKTTFLRMWAGELRQKEIPVVIFDAFKHDYLDDAFAAIAGAIFTVASEQSQGRKALDLFKQSAIKAAKVIARSSLKIGVKLASGGLIAATDLEGAAKDVGDEAGKAFDEHIGSLITKQRDNEAAFQAFREALSTLSTKLSPEDNPKPLIFIIDELDRCKPTFALEILERIKHFFSVPNVHFVLSVYLEQLNSMVQTEYGALTDSRIYLEKFIHFVINFNEKRSSLHLAPSLRYAHFLAERLGIKNHNSETQEAYINLISHWGVHQRISLRTIERVTAQVVLAIGSLPKNSIVNRPLLVALCFLKVKHPAVYRSILRKNWQYEEVLDSLSGRVAVSHSTYYEKLWEYVFSKNPDSKVLGDLDPHFRNYESRFDIAPSLSERYIETFKISDD